MRLISLVTALVILFTATASAADSGIDVASDEVFLDHRTGRFGDRLKVGYAAENINKVVVIAPEKAEVTLAYWPEGGDNGPCPNATPSPLQRPQLDRRTVLRKRGVVVRAGAPTGAVADYGGVRSQKSLVRVGPLRIGVDYCFHLALKAKYPLSLKEKAEVDSALNATVRYVSRLEPDSAQPQSKCPGAPDAATYNTGIFTPAQIAAVFRCELGWPGNQWRVIVPGVEPQAEVEIATALATFIDKDDKLKDALEQAWEARHAMQRSREDLESEQEKLLKAINAWPANGVLIDPLQRMKDDGSVKTIIDGKADIQAHLGNDKEMKSAFTDAVVADPDRLLEAIYKHRQVLQRVPGIQKMEDKDKKAILDAIFTASKEPKVFRLGRDDLRAILKSLEKGLNDEKARAVEIAKLRLLSRGLQSVKDELGVTIVAPDHKIVAPDHKRADAAVFSIFTMGTLHDQWTISEGIAAGLTTSQPYLKFREAIVAVQRETAVGGYQTAPTYVERFPFYVSADFGVLFGFLQRKDADSVTDVSSYFGLNIYLVPVDKEEELGLLLLNNNPWTARTFFRRFALNAGISITDFNRRDDLGVGGVIGDQLFMFGAGLRLTDYFRLSGGGILFSQRSPNPLNDETTLRTAPYLAVSADIDVFTEVKKLYTKASQ